MVLNHKFRNYNMPPDLIVFIANYGYLAIFLLIFSQEIGIPNPVPNELVLAYAGFLAFKGVLFWPFIILVASSADFLGTNLLYILFYLFGESIDKYKPKWLPFPKKRIKRLSERISKNGLWAIYLGRLTPFIRGYTSVAAGLLKIKPKVFLPITIFSATIWSSIYVISGRVLGPSLNLAENSLGNEKYLIVVFFVIIIFVITFKFLKRRFANH